MRPLVKATLRQLLIVVCLLSIISVVTPLPPPQESPHHDKDAGGDRLVTPPHPRMTATLGAFPTPQRGSSLSSPLRYSCCSEQRWSATWPMINTTGCRAKSSLSGGAVVPVRGHACWCSPGPGGPLCGGVARGVAPGSKVGGRGGGAGVTAQPPPPSCWAEYVSVTTGRMPGDTDQDLRRSETWLGNHRRLAGV